MSKLTFSSIKTAVEAAVTAYETRRENAFNSLVESAGVAPTIGKDGRFHAPCDGYVWGEQVYMGGQYLPYDEEDNRSYLMKGKYKIQTSIFEEFNQLFGGNCSMGKSWVQNGVEVAYAYCMLSRTQNTAMSKLVPEGGKIVVAVKEGETPTNSVWKWSDAKQWNKIVKSGLDIDTAEYLYSPGVKWVVEPGRKVKGKLREVYSDLDGKQVHYEYIDNTIYA